MRKSCHARLPVLVLALAVQALGAGEQPQAETPASAKPHARAASANAGSARLSRCPDHPYSLRWHDRHVLLLGVSDRQALTLWRTDKGFDWQRYLTTLAAHGVNYVRQDATTWIGLASMARYVAQFPEPRWAFSRTGPGVAVDGRLKFDLTRFDAGYFRNRLRPFLQQAQRLGMVVELTLFDRCRSRRAFNDSLYAPANNVNALGLQPGDDPHGDATLSRPRLLALQERYVAQVIEATRDFENVIYEVANETGGARWVAHFVAFVHQRLPGALVSAGEQTSAYDPVTGKCDLAVKHRGGAGLYRTDADVARHRAALRAMRRGGKPVVHNEFFLFANRSTDDFNFVRKMFWADFTGGGHANFYDFTWWRGTGRTMADGTSSRPPPGVILDGAGHLRRFIELGQVPFWRMAPHDELAKVKAGGLRPFVLACPGEVYVAYLVAGGKFAFDLSGVAGRWTGRWFNPRNGEFAPAFEIAGAGAQLLAAPDTNDWALLIQQGLTKKQPDGGP